MDHFAIRARHTARGWYAWLRLLRALWPGARHPQAWLAALCVWLACHPWRSAAELTALAAACRAMAARGRRS